MREKSEVKKGVKMEVKKGVKMEVKKGVKMEVKKGVKMDSCNSRFNSKTFKDLECWQKAHEFVLAVYRVTKQFPEDERYGLTSQFRRAAVSIAANICEGYKKLSKADKLRFMNIAQGSLEECRYYIILSRDIEYIDQQTHDHLEYIINGVSWKLNGYAEGISKNAGVRD